MPIESIPGGGTVFTGKSIEIFARRSAIGRLQIEQAGIRFRGMPTLKAVQLKYGLKSRTRAGAIRELEAQIEQLVKEEYNVVE